MAKNRFQGEYVMRCVFVGVQSACFAVDDCLSGVGWDTLLAGIG